jgi:hypothetical protein
MVMGIISVVLIDFNSRQSEYNSQEANTAQTSNSTPSGQRSIVAEADFASGRYTDYQAGLVDDEGYERTVLFFSADHDWCSQCQAFEQAIITSGVPDGIQILKLNFEVADELKKQYQVTIQTTFVEVDQSGQLVASWVGFAQEKSLEAILDGLKPIKNEE